MTSKVIKCTNCNIVICEVLAFVQNKMDVMDEESLVRLCTTAFSVEDIESAKSLLFDSISTTRRKIMRKRDGKSKRDLYDVITLLKETDPEEVPIFVARELQKLPPVTFDHIDATRLLKDLLILQNELSIIKESYVTMKQFDELKNELSSCSFKSKNGLQNVNLIRGGTRQKSFREADAIETDLHLDKSSPVPLLSGITSEILPSLSPTCEKSMAGSLTQAQITRVEPDASDSSLAQYNDCISPGSPISHAPSVRHENIQCLLDKKQKDNEWQLVSGKKKKNRYAGSKGKAVLEPNNKFRAAETKVPLFITNVDKQTTESDISGYILSKTHVDVLLKKIEMKKERNYNAYKILVPQQKLSLFLNDCLWPEGISFRRFIYFNKDKRADIRTKHVNAERIVKLNGN